MTIKYVFGDVALTFTAAAAGAYSSGPLENAGQARMAEAWVNITAVAGTTNTIDLKFQTSADGTTWSDVAGGTLPQLTAVGNARCSALVTGNFVQVVATLGGTGSPTATGAVGVVLI